ncbi:MAG: SIMPL domain-containing protein [Gemmatimonadota bacterium]|nr:SIMPL domain-containing protein [Gemmatimonadota bacterium]
MATAERHVPPNLAIVRLNFTAEGRLPRDAGRRLASRADSLRRALVTLGIPRDSLLTASEWYWWGGRVEPVVSGERYVKLPKPDALGNIGISVRDTTFRAHDAIEVRIRDLGKIGAVIDTALAHGVSDISGVQFQASEVSSARDEALKQATADAMRQAQAIAAASGMRLGRVISMSTYEESDRYSGALSLSEVTLQGGSGGGTEVIPRSIPISMTVYGRWELLPPQ